MTTASPSHPLALGEEAQDHPRAVVLLLNVGHALDHLFLLIFATAVVAIAAEFGFSRWEDLMPYGVGAFFLFGLGSLPSGRLGDLWGRRPMMLVFFFGIGAAAVLTALARGPWQLAGGLTLIGLFASIYHPVGSGSCPRASCGSSATSAARTSSSSAAAPRSGRSRSPARASA